MPLSSSSPPQYNALGQAAPAAPVRLPVGLPPGVASWAVSDALGHAVPAQLVPLTARDAALRALYNGSNATPVAWLCFEAALPAAGFASFFLTPAATAAEAPATAQSVLRVVVAPAGKPEGRGAGDPQITNGRLTLSFSAGTGFLSSYADEATGLSLPVAQSWLSYLGFNGSYSLDGSNQVRGGLPHSPSVLVGDPLSPPHTGCRQAARTSSDRPTRPRCPWHPAPRL